MPAPKTPASSRPRRKKDIYMPTVRVKAKRPERTAEQYESSGFSTVIPLTRQQQRIRSLGDVLQESAGVTVRSTGGTGAWSTLSIRGSSSAQVQILLDGIPLNHGGSSTLNLSDLPLDVLQRAVVYRGFAPVQLGGAMGGIVELHTRYPQQARVLQFTAGTGSDGTFKSTLWLGGRWQRWQLTGILHYLGTMGHFLYYDDRGTPLETGDDIPDQPRQNNESHTLSSLVKATWSPQKRLKLTLAHLLVFRHTGIPGLANFRSLSAQFQNVKNLFHLTLQGSHLPWIPLTWHSQVYVLHQQEAFRDLAGEIGLGRQDNTNQGTQFGWNAHLVWQPFAVWELTLSSQLRREGFAPYDAIFPEQHDPERSRWTWQPALQNILYLWDRRISFHVSGRWELYHHDFEQATSSTVGSRPSYLLHFPTGRLGARFRPWSWLWFQSNVGRYVRVPSFWEMFGDKGTIVGNPTLRPESGWMWDAGVVLAWKGHSIIEQVRLSYAFFGTHSADLIRYIQNSQRTMIAVNIDQAQIWGQEISLELDMLRWFRVHADFTWMDARNQSQNATEQGKQLPGRPQWEIAVRAELYRSWGQLYYTYTGLGGNYLDRANLQELAPRHFHTIGIGLRPALLLRVLGRSVPWTGLTVLFEIRNILDTRVATVPLQPALPNLSEIRQAIADYSGYPLSGRVFYVTVLWKV